MRPAFRLALLAAALLTSTAALAGPSRSYVTDRARVAFRADTPLQSIDATSTEGLFSYDPQSGVFTAQIPVVTFKFPNAQMEANFQTGHVPVNDPGPKDAAGNPTFPNRLAVLTGKLEKPLDVSKDGAHEVTLKGKLVFHGVAKEMAFKGNVSVKGTDLVLSSTFDVAPRDFGVALPRLGDKYLAENVKVTVDATLTPTP